MRITRLLVIAALTATTLHAQNTETVTVSGLIIPLDDSGMYVRTSTGKQMTVRWNEQIQVALAVNTRQFANLKGKVLHYKVHSSSQTVDFPLPSGPITGILRVRGGKQIERAIKAADEENWIPEFGLILRFGEAPKTEHLPSVEDPHFVGRWDPTTRPRTLSIKGRRYEVSLKKGGQTNALLFGVIGTQHCAPFINRAEVVGIRVGDTILADRIHVTPIGDQTATDDPHLPRYLVIGDSISGNYDRGLRQALKGRFNVHHPPTNCGPSGKGKGNVVAWLGAYEEPGRQWDVISFNFGHWDAGNTRAKYQENLEAVVAHLKRTGAKLIWVSTCPVPDGYPPARELQQKKSEGLHAPGRTAGVMKKYLNPWALEVIKRHPKISICNQWQFVKDHEDDIYKEWRAGKNVHFGGKQADELGKYLATFVLQTIGKD